MCGSDKSLPLKCICLYLCSRGSPHQYFVHRHFRTSRNVSFTHALNSDRAHRGHRVRLNAPITQSVHAKQINWYAVDILRNKRFFYEIAHTHNSDRAQSVCTFQGALCVLFWLRCSRFTVRMFMSARGDLRGTEISRLINPVCSEYFFKIHSCTWLSFSVSQLQKLFKWRMMHHSWKRQREETPRQVYIPWCDWRQSGCWVVAQNSRSIFKWNS